HSTDTTRLLTHLPLFPYTTLFRAKYVLNKEKPIFCLSNHNSSCIYNWAQRSINCVISSSIKPLHSDFTIDSAPMAVVTEGSPAAIASTNLPLAPAPKAIGATNTR